VVAGRLHVTPAMVCKCRGRFIKQRLDGLYDEPGLEPTICTRREARSMTNTV
jgi:hypothetical protein